MGILHSFSPLTSDVVSTSLAKSSLDVNIPLEEDSQEPMPLPQTVDQELSLQSKQIVFNFMFPLLWCLVEWKHDLGSLQSQQTISCFNLSEFAQLCLFGATRTFSPSKRQIAMEANPSVSQTDAAAAASANSNATYPLPVQRYTNLNELGHELSSLQELAFRGSWRSILDKVSRARSLSLLRLPHDHLLYLSFNVLALTKLRRYSEAVDDIDSLEDLDSSAYRYESYPKLYPDRVGSMVPFSLRWLHAQLPSLLGKRPETLDRLYKLLDFVRSQIRIKKDLGNLEVSLNVWRKREGFVMSAIIRHHLNQKEFPVCLDLMRDMLVKDPNNPVLLTKLGYVQMQFGDVGGARVSFDKVEELMKEGKFGEDGEALTEIEMRNLVGRNKALVYLVEKDYVSAVREYDGCIERDGSDVVAINNKAICLMYLRDLSDSIKVLESSLERIPTMALDETLVVNLCSMYELAYMNHPDIKKTLNNWISRVAPDDFDSSCTRI